MQHSHIFAAEPFNNIIFANFSPRLRPQRSYEADECGEVVDLSMYRAVSHHASAV